MNQLLLLYKRILESMDCIIDSEGNILSDIGNGELKPLVIEVGGVTKNLVLPTDEKRNKWDNDKWIAFHPACETIFKGQSEVINFLSNLAAVKLFKATQIAVIHILSLAEDKSKHNSLSRLKLKHLISELPDVSQNTLDYISSITKRTTGVYGVRPIMGLKFSIAPVIDGNKFNKSCKLITPILQEKDPIYDIKASNNSQRAVKRAYELVFPEVKEVGSNSDTTPYLDSLLGMFYTAANHLNELKEIMGKHGSNMVMIDVIWYEDSKNARKYMHQYLNTTFPGNTGTSNDERVATKQEIKVNPVMPVTSSPSSAPVAAIPSSPTTIALPPVSPNGPAVPFNPNALNRPPMPVPFNNVPVAPVASQQPNDLVQRLKNTGMTVSLGMPGMLPGAYPNTMMPGMMPGIIPNQIPGLTPGIIPIMPQVPTMAVPGVAPAAPRVLTRGHIFSQY